MNSFEKCTYTILPITFYFQEIEAASILGISDLSLATVQDLRDRLLGTTQLKTYHSKEVSLPKQLDTPAEEGMKNLLVQKSAISTSEFISDRASMALTGAAKPYLTKLSDQASASRNDFKCCTHCQGRSIHIVQRTFFTPRTHIDYI